MFVLVGESWLQPGLSHTAAVVIKRRVLCFCVVFGNLQPPFGGYPGFLVQDTTVVYETSVCAQVIHQALNLQRPLVHAEIL